MVGREDECETLDSLLDAARHGLSATLVVRGEAGIGKTALIDYAGAAAPDFLVVRFTGLEREKELGFAALHRLFTPILHQIRRLPAPQRDALSSALGLASGPPANRLLVGLGVISLAANAARARERLLCVIDDAQWVDRESIEALAFWGRRLHADGIALVFGERDGASPSPLDGFPVLEVGGLGGCRGCPRWRGSGGRGGFGMALENVGRSVSHQAAPNVTLPPAAFRNTGRVAIKDLTTTRRKSNHRPRTPDRHPAVRRYPA